MSIPALVVVVTLAVAGVVVMTDNMKCADAAATAARLAARGEPIDVVKATALRAAPAGATLHLVTEGTTVTAVVTDQLSGPGLLHRFGTFSVIGHSVAALETGAAAEPATPGAS